MSVRRAGKPKLTGNNNGLERVVVDALFDRLDAGWSIRKIAHDLEIAKNTVLKYKGLRDYILRRYGAIQMLRRLPQNGDGH